MHEKRPHMVSVQSYLTLKPVTFGTFFDSMGNVPDIGRKRKLSLYRVGWLKCL